MALTIGTIFEIRASATTANVNGAGFNPANANFPTDGTVDTNTGNTASPVFSSATYNFAAGDVGAWIYVKSGTNTIPGWYQIANVASNKATLSAAIGAGVTQSGIIFTATTVVGIATVGTPTSITFGVDYSQQDTAQTTATDFTAVGASTTLTSATAAFTAVMVGNFFHQTTTGTGAFGVVGWYEIVSFVNGTTVVTDRTTNNGTASVACTGFVGGAGRWNALEDSFGEMVPAGGILFFKNGSYTISTTVNITSTATATDVQNYIGYNALRGDACNGDNRPLIIAAANTFNLGTNTSFYNLRITTTAATGVDLKANTTLMNVKVQNTSSTAGRDSVGAGSVAGIILIGCEIVSQNGMGYTHTTGTARIHGCYLHDSDNGVTTLTANINAIACIFESHNTSAITTANLGVCLLFNNTIYGREAKIGIGVSLTGASSIGHKFGNNIFYGLVTGISAAALQTVDIGYYNDFFNNTTDVTNFLKGKTALALNPSFTGATQITGTTASGSGSVLTDTNADFSTVTDSVDYVRVLSGTGATIACFLITAHTTTTLTCNNTVGTNATADRVYYVTTGHNFGIGANLKSAGFPSFGTSMGIETTSAPAVGGVQQAASGTAYPYAG